MGKYILADNQDLTRFALETLIRQKGNTDIYKVSDKAGLIQLLKEHEDAVVLLDYTLFDFADENQLLIVAERFALSRCANWHSHPASPSRPSQEDLRLANDPTIRYAILSLHDGVHLNSFKIVGGEIVDKEVHL